MNETLGNFQVMDFAFLAIEKSYLCSNQSREDKKMALSCHTY